MRGSRHSLFQSCPWLIRTLYVKYARPHNRDDVGVSSLSPSRRGDKAPWLCWPEHHVYAHDRGPFHGLGMYNHAPLPYAPRDHTAVGSWIDAFNAPLQRAQKLRRIMNSCESVMTVPETKFNGLFDHDPQQSTFGRQRSLEEGSVPQCRRMGDPMPRAWPDSSPIWWWVVRRDLIAPLGFHSIRCASRVGTSKICTRRH